MKFGEIDMNTTTSENPPQENKTDDVENTDEAEKLEILENELDEAIEENKEDEMLDEECENKRLEAWKDKSPEKKKEVIEDKKKELEEDLRKDVKIPEDVLREESELREYQGELRKAVTDFIREREDFLGGVHEHLDGNVDVSELSSMEQGEFRNILSDIRNVTQNTLDIEKIDYYLTEDYSSTEEGIEKGLLETHEDRLIAMERLEDILKQIGEFEKCLEDISDVEAAKEEVERMVSELEKIAKEKPDLFEKLKKAGIVVGIIMLALALGIGALNLIKAAGTLAAKVASNKIAIGTVGTVGTIGVATNAGTIASALVGGGVMLKMMAWLSKEENRDNLAKDLCGVGDFPKLYYALGGKKAKPSDSK